MASHKVGGEVDAWCTRCRLTLAHTILAMVGTRIARVRCNTCGGDHAFRSAPGTTDKPATTARSSSSASRASRAESAAEKVIITFEEQLASKDVANAMPYTPRDTYKVDQVVQHPTFGLGLVTAVRGDKVEILFKTDTKTMVHGRGGPAAGRPAFQPPAGATITKGPADKPPSLPDTDPSAPSSSPAPAEE